MPELTGSLLLLGLKVHTDRDRQVRRFGEAQSTLQAAQELMSQASSNSQVPRCLIDSVGWHMEQLTKICSQVEGAPGTDLLDALQSGCGGFAEALEEVCQGLKDHLQLLMDAHARFAELEVSAKDLDSGQLDITKASIQSELSEAEDCFQEEMHRLRTKIENCQRELDLFMEQHTALTDLKPKLDLMTDNVKFEPQPRQVAIQAVLAKENSGDLQSQTIAFNEGYRQITSFIDAQVHTVGEIVNQPAIIAEILPPIDDQPEDHKICLTDIRARVLEFERLLDKLCGKISASQRYTSKIANAVTKCKHATEKELYSSHRDARAFSVQTLARSHMELQKAHEGFEEFLRNEVEPIRRDCLDDGFIDKLKAWSEYVMLVRGKVHDVDAEQKVIQNEFDKDMVPERGVDMWEEKVQRSRHYVKTIEVALDRATEEVGVMDEQISEYVEYLKPFKEGERQSMAEAAKRVEEIQKAAEERTKVISKDYYDRSAALSASIAKTSETVKTEKERLFNKVAARNKALQWHFVFMVDRSASMGQNVQGHPWFSTKQSILRFAEGRARDSCTRDHVSLLMFGGTQRVRKLTSVGSAILGDSKWFVEEKIGKGSWSDLINNIDTHFGDYETAGQMGTSFKAAWDGIGILCEKYQMPRVNRICFFVTNGEDTTNDNNAIHHAAESVSRKLSEAGEFKTFMCTVGLQDAASAERLTKHHEKMMNIANGNKLMTDSHGAPVDYIQAIMGTDVGEKLQRMFLKAARAITHDEEDALTLKFNAQDRMMERLRASAKEEQKSSLKEMTEVMGVMTAMQKKVNSGTQEHVELALEAKGLAVKNLEAGKKAAQDARAKFVLEVQNQQELLVTAKIQSASAERERKNCKDSIAEVKVLVDAQGGNGAAERIAKQVISQHDQLRLFKSKDPKILADKVSESRESLKVWKTVMDSKLDVLDVLCEEVGEFVEVAQNTERIQQRCDDAQAEIAILRYFDKRTTKDLLTDANGASVGDQVAWRNIVDYFFSTSGMRLEQDHLDYFKEAFDDGIKSFCYFEPEKADSEMQKDVLFTVLVDHLAQKPECNAEFSSWDEWKDAQSDEMAKSVEVKNKAKEIECLNKSLVDNPDDAQQIRAEIRQENTNKQELNSELTRAKAKTHKMRTILQRKVDKEFPQLATFFRKMLASIQKAVFLMHGCLGAREYVEFVMTHHATLDELQILNDDSTNKILAQWSTRTTRR